MSFIRQNAVVQSRLQAGAPAPVRVRDNSVRNVFKQVLFPCFGLVLSFPLTAADLPSLQRTLLAGDENGLPTDMPSLRIDSLGGMSPFNFVGALHIQSGGRTFYGTASVLSSHWVLTAGHNLDPDDNGVADAGIQMSLALPGYGSFTASGFSLNPGFTGFGTSSIGSDLGLLYLDSPLPLTLSFPSLYSGLAEGDTVTLVGFGRSGYGSYGYTTEAGTTDRRVGMNVVDSFSLAGGGSGPNVFHYDFDAPDTLGQPGGSLGNNVETIIGPGDSGGPILFALADGFGIAGVSTFTEGYGGRFGDIGGGVLIGPHLDWINSTMAIPEPSSSVLMLLGAVALFCAVRRARDRQMA